MELLARLTRNLPLTLAVLAVIVLVIVVLLVLFIRKRRVKPAPAASLAPAEPPAEGAVVIDFRQASSQQRLSAAFRRAVAELRRHLGGRDSRYRLPWVVLLGEEAAAKHRLFPGSGLNLPLGQPEEPSPEKGEGCAFWLCDRGVVLDVSGDLVLGPGGRNPNERGWRHFLSLLRETRPERPIDSVVVAIPCSELIGPPEGEGQRLTDAAEKGASLFRRLRQLQETLGMAFPVYVLVTNCEEVPGFESFVHEVPEHLRGDLFGWSNPYAPETAYRAEWVDEAFTRMGTALHRAQIEAFGDQSMVEDPDGVFCFAGEFQRLRVALRAYLNQVFRASSYHELLPFRGLYFCGRIPEGDAASRFYGAATVGGSVFVRDVFDTRVFPERDLAHPTSLALIQGGRRLQVLRAAVVALALISTLGVWWGYSRLKAREDDLHSFLVRIAEDMDDVRQFHHPRSNYAQHRDYLKKKTYQVLYDFSLVNGDRFGSLFLPSSWFSSFNRDLTRATVEIYDDLIFETLVEELDFRLGEAVRQARPLGMVEEGAALAAAEPAPADPADAFIAWEAPPPLDDGPVEVQALSEMATFQQLKTYVETLRTLEQKAVLFNALHQTKSLRSLDEVVEYLLGQKLPDSFFRNAGLYTRALGQVKTTFPPEEESQEWKTPETAFTLANSLYVQLFDRNPAVLELEGTAALANQVAAASLQPGGSPISSLLELRDRLRRAEEALNSPRLAWMGGDTLNLGPAYQQVLATAGSTVFVGPDTSGRIQAEGERQFQIFRRRLLSIQAGSLGRLVAADPKSGALGLSPEVKLLSGALGGLSSQGFAVEPAGEVALPPARRVVWDTASLHQAAALYLPYETFVGKTLEPFPPDLRNTLQTSARNQLAFRMMEQVAASRRQVAEPDSSSPVLLEQALEVQVANFQAAAAPIAQLETTFEKLGLSADAHRVAAAYAAQGEQILADADLLLRLKSPYTPKGDGFGWWNGGKRPGLEAFAAADEGELVAYLANQRDTVADIADNFARPVMKALGGRLSSRSLRASMSRWTAISEQLDRYQAKEPGNSVAALEEMILKDLLEVEPANCSRRITSRMLSEPAGDFFQARRAALRRDLYGRCRALADNQAVDGYRRVEAFFNQRLAGKFPFASGAPGPLDTEADPEDLRAFYRLYASYAPILEAVPEPDRPPAVYRFLDRVRDVRTFFATFLDDPLRPEAPAFDLNVRFRQLRREERGADRIFRWSLASGEQVATHPYSGPPLRWTYGTPLRLELQWAKDAPVVPVQSPELPGVGVDRQTAAFEYTNRWALLALLRDLAVPELTEDPSAPALRLRVATRPVDQPQAAPEQARVFLRMSLRSPQVQDQETTAKDPAAATAPDLDIPVFPISAPRWVTAAGEDL